MALPRGYSKDDKKNSVGFNVFLKQRETRAARKNLAPDFFRSVSGKKHAIRARIIKSCRPHVRFRGLPAAILLHLSRPETGSAPGPPAQVQPQKLSEMEFLNKIELRGIVGQSSLNRVGDSQVCRFSLVTEYSYKDRGNNPVVDVTWFNITAWEGKNMPELHLIGKGVIVQVAGRVRTFRFTMADGAERSGWEILARRVTILPSDDDPVQPQRFL